MFFSRYAKFMFAPDTGADGGASASETSATEVDNTDYKALYEKEVAKRASDKKSYDQTASELAAMKKAARDKMSEEEKREAQLAEEREYWKGIESELNQTKVANVFAKQGYDEKDYSDLVKKLSEIGGKNAIELAENFVDFVKKSNNNAVANAKNAMIKDGAVAPKSSTAQSDGKGAKSDYQLYQESKTKTNNIVNL